MTHLRRDILDRLVLHLRVLLHRVRDLRVLDLIPLLQRPSRQALEGLPGCQLGVLDLVGLIRTIATIVMSFANSSRIMRMTLKPRSRMNSRKADGSSVVWKKAGQSSTMKGPK